MESMPRLDPLAVRPIDMVQFADEQFKAVSLALTEQYKMMVLGFRPGQFIPVHAPDVDLLALVLRGKGYAEIGGKRTDLEPGMMVGAPRQVARGIFAEDEMVVLVYVSPVPGAGDHKDVDTGLSTKQFQPGG